MRPPSLWARLRPSRARALLCIVYYTYDTLLYRRAFPRRPGSAPCLYTPCSLATQLLDLALIIIIVTSPHHITFFLSSSSHTQFFLVVCHACLLVCFVHAYHIPHATPRHATQCNAHIFRCSMLNAQRSMFNALSRRPRRAHDIFCTVLLVGEVDGRAGRNARSAAQCSGEGKGREEENENTNAAQEKEKEKDTRQHASSCVRRTFPRPTSHMDFCCMYGRRPQCTRARGAVWSQ